MSHSRWARLYELITTVQLYVLPACIGGISDRHACINLVNRRIAKAQLLGPSYFVPATWSQLLGPEVAVYFILFWLVGYDIFHVIKPNQDYSERQR